MPGNPAGALRNACSSVLNVQTTVPPCSRFGGRPNSARICWPAATPQTTGGPPPCQGAMAANPSEGCESAAGNLPG